MPPRDTSIDILKIAAMFMVVYYHGCYYSLDFGYCRGSADYLPNAARALMNLCSMGVPLFLMCSGYCTLAAPSAGWRKMGRKVLTILLLTLFWHLLIPFPAWFFLTLAALYLATPLLRAMRQRCPWLYRGGIACVFLATFGLNEAHVLSRPFTPNMLDSLPVRGLFTSYALVYYALGAWLRGRDIPPLHAATCLAAGFALSLLDGTLLTRAQGELFDGVNTAFPMLSTLLMSFGCFAWVRHARFSPQSPTGRALATVSGGCLGVYLLHLFLQLEISELFCRALQLEHLRFSIPLSLAWALFIWAISWALGMGIRRIPYLGVVMKL